MSDLNSLCNVHPYAFMFLVSVVEIFLRYVLTDMFFIGLVDGDAAEVQTGGGAEFGGFHWREELSVALTSRFFFFS